MTAPQHGGGHGGPLEEVAAALEARLPGRVTRDVPSGRLTTWRAGGPLRALVRAGSTADLRAVAEAVGPSGVDVLVVGRGSNLLVADRGFDGLAVVLDGDLEAVVADPGSAQVRAGGASALPVVARQAAAACIGGLEFYVGIPGTVGGAVRMNAGGHGRDTAEVLVEATVCDLRSGSFRECRAADLSLGYRRSALGSADVVVRARFAGEREDREVVEQRVADIVRWRREHQPGGPNAGSVFTNPPGDSAGRLVDACGLKGARVGGAVVSAKHANFIQAEPGATAADILALILLVRDEVAARTGVRLEPEVRLVGFDEEAR
jgi:UDP-N-acetylmuramate dehydrogenase